jgi:signal transduction histidine kinase/AraC-like DNA-binding protein
VEAFHRRYEGLPLVCIAQSVRGAPTVAMDAYHGMREVILHLLDAHGVRRIAFVRGPATHPSAEDRFRAYRDALSESGLAFNDALVTRPLAWDQGAEAPRILMDEKGLRPGRDFQAVAAASDLLALWALKSFQERGLRVPADLLVTGFNDTAESRLATPPLTTASVPFAAQGGRALSMLTALMAGQETPREVTLPARLLVRRSCGCPSAAASLAVSDAAASPVPDLAAALRAVREECLAEMTELSRVGPEGRTAWLEPLLDSFIDDIGGTSMTRFRLMLDNVLDRAILADSETDAWQDAVSALRRRVLGLIAPAGRSRVEDLFSQVRVLVAEAAARQRTWRQWRADRLAQSVREVGTALLSAFDVGRIADTLADGLPRLGIQSFALALYEDVSRESAAGPETGGAQARLVLARTEAGRAELPRDGLLFPAAVLIPREFLPRTRRYDLVVEPLHFQDQRIGYAVFEIGPADGAVYEQLRGSITSALKGALLLRDAREARAVAEKADLIKTRLLANVSHELRAPLGIILQQARASLDSLPAGRQDRIKEGLARIHGSAEHQLRVIDDLLDLSRADINELDLDRALIDPRALLDEVFRSVSAQGAAAPGVTLAWDVPERLPVVRADPVRLRQILFNLLGNALKFTRRGSVRLCAEVAPPSLFVRVSDTGPGIRPDLLERIFEPFVTAAAGGESGAGIGLGLAISRHLAALHGGELSVHSTPGEGSTFTVRLPLPGLDEEAPPLPGPVEPVLLLVSRSSRVPAEIGGFCRRQGLRVVRIDDAAEDSIASLRPAALAWDLSDAEPGDWPLLRRLRHHPGLSRAPMVVYGGNGDEPGPGLTGLLPKHAAGSALMDLIEASCPPGSRGPVLVVDDDPSARASHTALVGTGLPGTRVRSAADGRAALRAMEEEVPSLVLLDLAMPLMDGMEVLEHMRADQRLRRVPVIVLTNRLLSDAEVARLEKHAKVTLQAKGVWSDSEAAAALHRALFGTDQLPPQTGALVKRAVAWLARNHARPISRWQLAEAVNASPDYVGRVFQRELGISPLDYLNRYRVHRAAVLLEGTTESVKAIAGMVGFRDQAYFSRVFRKVTGTSPQDLRQRQ